MDKVKLIQKRKSNGLSQSAIAEKLCMDVSNYNRREKGQVKIPVREWEKLAEILDVPIEDIYEPDDDSQFFSTVQYQGTNHIHSVPEYLLETQRKYIERLENEIRELKEKLEKKKSE